MSMYRYIVLLISFFCSVTDALWMSFRPVWGAFIEGDSLGSFHNPIRSFVWTATANAVGYTEPWHHTKCSVFLQTTCFSNRYKFLDLFDCVETSCSKVSNASHALRISCSSVLWWSAPVSCRCQRCQRSRALRNRIPRWFCSCWFLVICLVGRLGEVLLRVKQAMSLCTFPCLKIWCGESGVHSREQSVGSSFCNPTEATSMFRRVYGEELISRRMSHLVRKGKVVGVSFESQQGSRSAIRPFFLFYFLCS